MFDKSKFKYHVDKAGKNLEDVANAVGINPATLTRKMSGESDFTRNEIQLIRNYLKLSVNDAEDIFFKQKLT